MFWKPFFPISISSPLVGESTLAKAAGLVIAQLGQILNYCLLAPNPLCALRFVMHRLGPCNFLSALPCGFMVGFVNRGHQREMVRQEEEEGLSASCLCHVGIQWVTPGSLLYPKRSSLFLQQQLNSIFQRLNNQPPSTFLRDTSSAQQREPPL